MSSSSSVRRDKIPLQQEHDSRSGSPERNTDEYSYLSTQRVSPRSSGNPDFVLGLSARKAWKCLPIHPDQGWETILWVMVMGWIGRSYPMYKPSQMVRRVLGLITDVQSYGLTGNRNESLAVVSPTLDDLLHLSDDFGIVQVVRALLGCCFVYILLNHQCDPSVKACYALANEALAEFERWASSFR